MLAYLLIAVLASQSTPQDAPAPAAGPAAGARSGFTTPRPVLHVAGRIDMVVPFAHQERTIQALNEVHAAGARTPWPAFPGLTLHRASNGDQVATPIHHGTHAFPAAAPECIARLLRHTRRASPWVTEPACGPGLVQHVYASRAAGT